MPQGSPIAPLYSNIYLHWLDQVWHKRGYPQTPGATLPRYCDEAILVGRKHAPQALEACEAIARRRGLERNQETPRLTKWSDGFDCLGSQCGKRRSPTPGKWSIYIVPSQESPRQMRRRSKYVTKRRAPAPPDACVRQINEAVRGGGQYDIHTTASQALRALQRFSHPRLRRDLPYRRNGRGVGWRRDPNRRREAMGLSYIGSGHRRHTKAPAHALG